MRAHKNLSLAKPDSSGHIHISGKLTFLRFKKPQLHVSLYETEKQVHFDWLMTV